jgi:hypothetical protein
MAVRHIGHGRDRGEDKPALTADWLGLIFMFI